MTNVDNGIRFCFAGKELVGNPSDTVATALLRNGVRVFDRSIKLRRKRGPNCLEGFCMSCLLQVDGKRDVVSCRTPLENGMDVRPQVALPTPGLDLFAPLQGAFTSIFSSEGIYKLFTRPAWARDAWLRLLARRSGRGRLCLNHPLPDPPLFNTLTTDVLIIGAGVAGMASAVEAASLGLQVLLVDRGHEGGGWYAKWNTIGGPPTAMDPIAEPLSQIPDEVQFLRSTTLVGLYSDKSALAINAHEVYRIFYQVAIIAVGCYPKLIYYPGSDQPLHMPIQGLLRAYIETGWAPSSIVLLDFDQRGAELSRALQHHGTEVKLLPMNASSLNPEGLFAVNHRDEYILTLESGDKLHAEAICWSGGWRPREELIGQGGGRLRYDQNRDAFIPMLHNEVFISDNTLVAGGCAGVTGFDSAQRHGQLAGAAAAAKLNLPTAQRRYDELLNSWEIQRTQR